MRHQKQGRKFGRERNQRKAFLKGLVRAFILSGKIETTVPRAKETQRLAERLVTSAKKGTVASKRTIISAADPEVMRKLFELAPAYAARAGGYTRITKIRARSHDRATMALLEFV